MLNNADFKTALVHDDLIQAGGAERVVASLHALFPRAPLYTSIYDPRSTLPCFADMDVRTSFLQRTPLAMSFLHKLALPFFPAAFEEFDFSGFDLVLSSASRFAKGVITQPGTCHVCYCHTPPRFAWRPHDYLARNRAARLLVPFMRGLMRDLRAWDIASAQRVDYFVANSQNVARRIRKYYRREATVVPPPVETNRFAPAPADEIGPHFLVVSRLVGYKRVDLAIEACNQLSLPLRVVGTGPEEAALRRRAGPTVQFLGKLPDHAVAAEMARCRALIFPGEEDFGLTPVECMASGRPVVAYAAGGALETVVDGVTGLLFTQPTSVSLGAALRTVSELVIEPAELQAHAAHYNVPVFERRLRRVLEEALDEHQKRFAPGRGSRAVWDERLDGADKSGHTIGSTPARSILHLSPGEG